MTHVEDVDEAEQQRRLTDPAYSEAMAYAIRSLARSFPQSP
ncbi:hypothetical protein [Streptomyces sp. NPDC059909]